MAKEKVAKKSAGGSCLFLLLLALKTRRMLLKHHILLVKKITPYNKFMKVSIIVSLYHVEGHCYAFKSRKCGHFTWCF